MIWDHKKSETVKNHKDCVFTGDVLACTTEYEPGLQAIRRRKPADTILKLNALDIGCMPIFLDTC